MTETGPRGRALRMPGELAGLEFVDLLVDMLAEERRGGQRQAGGADPLKKCATGNGGHALPRLCFFGGARACEVIGHAGLSPPG